MQAPCQEAQPLRLIDLLGFHPSHMTSQKDHLKKGKVLHWEQIVSGLGLLQNLLIQVPFSLLL